MAKTVYIDTDVICGHARKGLLSTFICGRQATHYTKIPDRTRISQQREIALCREHWEQIKRRL
jgi:hypothetical protein